MTIRRAANIIPLSLTETTSSNVSKWPLRMRVDPYHAPRRATRLTHTHLFKLTPVNINDFLFLDMSKESKAEVLLTLKVAFLSR